MSSEFRVTYSSREWGIWVFHRKIFDVKMMNYSLSTHRVARWKTFVTHFSVSARTLIIENDKEKNSSVKKVDENKSRVLWPAWWYMHMPLSLMQKSIPVNVHSDAARNSLSLFHKQDDISPGWMKGTSKETVPEHHQAVWSHYLAIQVTYSSSVFKLPVLMSSILRPNPFTFTFHVLPRKSQDFFFIVFFGMYTDLEFSPFTLVLLTETCLWFAYVNFFECSL